MFIFEDVTSVQAGIDLAVLENRYVLMKFAGSADDVLKEITDTKGSSVSQFDDNTSLFIEPPAARRNSCRPDKNHQCQ
jgi:hypothetical protein